MLVDVHAHVSPPTWLAVIQGMGGSFEDRFCGMPDPVPMPERLQMMKEAGVARQVLSPPTAPYSLDRDRAAVASRQINDLLAELSVSHPHQFDFWVSLPLPHVELALAEIERGLDRLNGRGVVLGCFCLGESIADARFDPVYEELNRRGAIVFLHPCQNGICSKHINDWGLTVCAGASLEDSVAALHLIKARIPSRFPRLRFIVPHVGGILPTLLPRLDGQLPQGGLPEAPSVTARRFFYDTVTWGSRPALKAAVEAFGVRQLVTGSDFPFLLQHESYVQTFANLADCDFDAATLATLRSNAASLLYGAEQR